MATTRLNQHVFLDVKFLGGAQTSSYRSIAPGQSSDLSQGATAGPKTKRPDTHAVLI